jgi:acyl-CoA thioester hydrolase
LPEIDVARLEADPRVVWNEDVLRFGDTDLNGHVNNSVFAVLAESGRVNLFRTRLGDGRNPDSYFVIAKLTIEFRRELQYPGKVRIGTWLVRIGRTSLGIKQVLLDDGAAVGATAEAVCVSMSRATRRPTPFADATRALAEPMLRIEA